MVVAETRVVVSNANAQSPMASCLRTCTIPQYRLVVDFVPHNTLNVRRRIILHARRSDSVRALRLLPLKTAAIQSAGVVEHHGTIHGSHAGQGTRSCSVDCIRDRSHGFPRAARSFESAECCGGIGAKQISHRRLEPFHRWHVLDHLCQLLDGALLLRNVSDIRNQIKEPGLRTRSGIPATLLGVGVIGFLLIE